MSIITKLKSFSRVELASVAFYAVAGLIMLVFLPLTGFPPQLAFLGILSLITFYSIFAGRVWASWLVFIMFASATAFSLYTLFSVGFSNFLLGISMIAYAVLTWLVTTYLLLLKRKVP